MRVRRSLDREILDLALPAIGSNLTLLLHHSLDTWWVGRMPEPDAPLAALSIATFTVWIFSSVAALVDIGLTSLVARYVGAARPAAARYIAYQGLLAALALGLASAFGGWLMAPLVYDMATGDPEVSEAGTQYVRIFWAGGTTILLERASHAIFRAHGNTLTPMLISVVGLAINTALNPVLMFGYAGLPALGVAGVAWATIISTGVTAVILLLLVARRGLCRASHPGEGELKLAIWTRVGPAPESRLALDTVLLRRVVRVGLPVAVSGLLFSLIYLVISRVTAQAGGTAAQAALGIGHRGESVAFILCTGYSAAAASLVGRRMGSGDPDAAARTAWRSLGQCAILCGLWSLVLYFGSGAIASIFTGAGETRDHAIAYYQIIAWCLVPQAAELVLEGAFGGAGLTVPPMVISVTLTSLRIPLCYLAASPSGAGVIGIWWAISATAILRGVVMAYWFHRGRWKEHSV